DASAAPRRRPADLMGRLPQGEAGPTTPQWPSGRDRVPQDADSAVVLEGVGTWDPPTTLLDADSQGIPYATYGFAAQIAEVEVDPVLATTRVAEMVAAHDAAGATNPTRGEGQTHGGTARGLGRALMEESAPARTENLHAYLTPPAGDVPPIRIYLIED